MGARFSAPLQSGPGARAATYTLGTESYPGVKLPGRGVDHPPSSSPRLKNEYSFTSTPSLGFRGLLLGELDLYTTAC